MSCIFCKIVNKQTPADIVYENDKTLAFKDVNPRAPVHIVFIPKRHIEWRDKFDEEDLSLLAQLIFAAKKNAIEQKINESYKLVFNIGKAGHISHIHLHLLGGWKKEIPEFNI